MDSRLTAMQCFLYTGLSGAFQHDDPFRDFSDQGFWARAILKHPREW